MDSETARPEVSATVNFKTITECDLWLVAHSVLNQPYDDDSLDFFPCSAARVSFGMEDKTGQNGAKDIKLMKYLADHEHLSPFEHQSATFLIEVPLFIRSQIMRHRTFAYNEISRRYTDENLEFWVPEFFRKQAASNRQASTDEKVEPFILAPPGDIEAYEQKYGKIAKTDPVEYYKLRTKYDLGTYEDLLAAGVSREQARAVLPQSLLTKFYMTGNLRNWAHFIRLRVDEHAQYEVRVVAERIRDQLKALWPNATEALLIESK